MLTPEQKNIRMTGVGASEVSAIVGLNPYRGALDVWCSKPTPSRPPFFESSEDPDGLTPMAVGEELERGLLSLLTRRIKVEFVMPRITMRHPSAPHVLASPDGVARKKRGAEIKVVGSRMVHHWGESGTADVPDYVLTQCAQNMAVLGAEVWFVGALINGNDFRTYTIERDLVLEDGLVDAVEDFWRDHVETDEPPDSEDPDERRRYLLARYPGSEKTACRLVEDGEIAAHVARYRELTAAIEAAEAEKSAREVAICEAIGESYGIEGRWGKAIWYRRNGNVRWNDVAEELAGGVLPPAVTEKHRGNPSRVFRIYAPKKGR